MFEIVKIEASPFTICFIAYNLMCSEGGDGIVIVVSKDHTDLLVEAFRNLRLQIMHADRLKEHKLPDIGGTLFTDESNENILFTSKDINSATSIDDFIIVATVK